MRRITSWKQAHAPKVQCKSCKKGLYLPTADVIFGKSGKYVHKCNSCGDKALLLSPF